MKQVFPSAISWWLFGPVLALPLLPLLRWQPTPDYLLVLALLLAISAFLLYLIRTTTYTLTPAELLIRCGFIRYQVPVASITRVTPSRNPLSSPALSLNRLEVRFGRYDSVLISPANQAGFLSALSHFNPAINHA